MITQLRRGLKSKAAKNIILWTIILMLASGLIVTKLFHKASEERGATTVNGKEISRISYVMKIDENRRQVEFFRRYFGAEADKYLKMMGLTGDPAKAAFETVIKQELVNQAADKMDICLGSDFIAKKMSEKDFLQKEFSAIPFDEIIDQFGAIDQDVLRRYLRMMRLTYADFESVLLKAIKREAINAIASGASYVPAFEVRDKYIANHLAKKYSVLMFDFDSFFKKAKEKKVGKEQLRYFYDEQNKLKKRYWVPEKRSGVAYVFDAGSYGVTLEDEDMQRYYDDNKRKLYIKENAKVQVRRILFKLEDGIEKEPVFQKARKIRSELVVEPSKFADVAKEISDDKETAEQGGLLPFFSRGQRDRALEEVALSLSEDGAISDVIETADGYEIIQREKRKETEFKAFAEVKDEIRKILRSREFKKLFANDMNEMLRTNGFDKDKFEELISRSTQKEDVELQVKREDGRSKSLFRIRENIPAFHIEDDKGVVVSLQDLQKRHLPLLDQIEETVADDFYEQEASKALQALLKKAEKEAKNKTLDELKKVYDDEYKVAFDQSGWVKQGDTVKTAALRAKGYPVEIMLSIDKPGFVAHYKDETLETSDGYLVKLDEVEVFNDKEYGEKKDEIKKSLINERKLAQLEEFIAFLRKKAKIKINR